MPSVRTATRGWLGLDELGELVVGQLRAEGAPLSPFAVATVLRLARAWLDREDAGGAEVLVRLVPAVHGEARRAGVLLSPGQVGRVLEVYAEILARLQVLDVLELGV